MRPVWQATAFLLAIVFISLLYKLPAKFVYQQISQDSPVKLIGVSGSIWSGRARQLQLQQLTLENLDWKLSPLALLIGDIAVHWELDDNSAKLSGELDLSSSQFVLNNTQGQINLVALAQRLPPQEVLLGGTVNINITEINLQQEKIANAKGMIEWQQAELLSPENITFGGFKANLTNDTGHLLLELSDNGGAVFLSGYISSSIGGAFKYLIKIGVRDTTVPGLLDGFNQLGQTDENGNVSLQGNGYIF